MAKTALLVIDMQNAFADMVTASTPNVLRLIKHFHNLNLPVIFTHHGHTDAEIAASPPTNQLVRKWTPAGSIRVESRSWAMLPAVSRVMDSGRDRVVPKNTYDAFLGSEVDGPRLEDLLREAAVQRVVICGVMTDCCCDTTGRSAFNRGWETWMVGDACASVDKQQHEAGLKAWSYGYGPIVSTEDVIETNLQGSKN